MASPALTGLLLAAGGAAAYAVFKMLQAKNSLGNTIVNAIGGVVSDVENQFEGQGGTYNAQAAADSQSNDALNGAIAIPLATGQSVAVSASQSPQWNAMMNGNALVYANGCVPFINAPGAANCASGTKSMYARDIAQRAGINYGETIDEDHYFNATDSFDTPARDELPGGGWLNGEFYLQYQDGPDGADYSLYYEAKDKLLLTGQGGDPATAGPFGPSGSGHTFQPPSSRSVHNGAGHDSANGGPLMGEIAQTAAEAAQGRTWIVRGKRLTCNAGDVPRTIYQSKLGLPITNSLGTEDCIDSNDPTLRCNGTKAPAGQTWSDEAQDWTALASGQTANNGPCDPSYSYVGIVDPTYSMTAPSSTPTTTSSSTPVLSSQGTKQARQPSSGSSSTSGPVIYLGVTP